MRKQPYLAALALLLSALILAACNFPMPGLQTPTPTPTSTPTPLPTATPVAEPTGIALGDSCLSGAWEIRDLSIYLNTVLPQNVLQDGTLTATGSTGSLRYTFGPDGKVLISAESFKIDTQLKLAVLTLPLTVTLNGSGKVDYQADPQNGTLQLSNPVDSGLTVSADLAGNSVLADTPVGDLAFLGAKTPDGVAQVGYHCTADSLEIVPQPDATDKPANLSPWSRSAHKSQIMEYFSANYANGANFLT